LAETAQLANEKKNNGQPNTTSNGKASTNSTHRRVAAERHCQKLHAGQVPWTPILTQAIYQILYWKGIHKQILGGNFSRMVLKIREAQGEEKFQIEHFNLGTGKVTKCWNPQWSTGQQSGWALWTLTI